MDEQQRSELIAGLEAMDEAHAAFRAELARYVSVGREGEGIPSPEKVLTPEALKELDALEKRVTDAQQRYYELLRKFHAS